MNLRINKLLIVLVLLVSCKKDKSEVPQLVTPELKVEETYFSTKHLIEVSELEQIIGTPNIKLIDFRKSEGYNEEHIIGAINMWRSDIENRSYPYGGMMATREQIESLFSLNGIKNTDTLVIYDDDASCNAARLWWVLKYYGFNNTKLLNGGLPKWKEEGNEVSKVVPTSITAEFRLENDVSNNIYSNLESIKEIEVNKRNMLLDTRTNDEFSGKRQKKGASKGGRIPNSTMFDWANAVNYNEDQTFKSYKILRDMYSSIGVTKDKTIYVYCHSGVRSAHTTFMLTELLGFKNVKNYDGSWIEYSYFEKLPIEKDSITTIF